MKIIKEGKNPYIVKFICLKCGCIFEAKLEEYSVECDRDPWYCVAICPCCGKKVFEDLL